MREFLSLFAAFLLSSCARASFQDCQSVLVGGDITEFTGICQDQWADLKPLIMPTQRQVGYAYVQFKLEHQFNTAKNAQRNMDKSLTPAVIGPGSLLYIVDRHHTLSTLDFSGFNETFVTIEVISDKRHFSDLEFWRDLRDKSLTHHAERPNGDPNELPVHVGHDEMPDYFSFTATNKSLVDNPWRSLSGLSRKVTNVPGFSTDHHPPYKYHGRCMYRGCDNGYEKYGSRVPFFEFRWSYFFNDASIYHPQYWDNASDHRAFLNYYTALLEQPVGEINTTMWLTAAKLLVPLCRSEAAGSYALPATLFNNSDNGLPGYVEGYKSLPKDPACSGSTHGMD